MRTTPNGQYRPKCANIGCEDGAGEKKRNLDGTIRWRTFCDICRDYPTSARPGVIAVKDNVCANHDSHLGITCGCTDQPRPEDELCILQVDHIDGNRYNNVPENLKTICANAHAYKTKQSGDHKKRYPREVTHAKTTYDELFF